MFQSEAHSAYQYYNDQFCFLFSSIIVIYNDKIFQSSFLYYYYFFNIDISEQ